jgi:hypothetical protein
MDPLAPVIKPELLDELLNLTKDPNALFGAQGVLQQLKGALQGDELWRRHLPGDRHPNAWAMKVGTTVVAVSDVSRSPEWFYRLMRG